MDLCLNDGRYAEAILLAISGGEELLKKTQQKYLSKQKSSVSMVRVYLTCYGTNTQGGYLDCILSTFFPQIQLISSVVTQNWRDIVQSCELDNWKEALAALLTYAHPEEFARLCGKSLSL